jgi:excisionase family DNA binding protein
MDAEYFTPQDVADRLQLSVKTVLDYLRTGKLGGVKAGKHWRIRPADIDAFLRPSPAVTLVAPAREPPQAPTPVVTHQA